jgi:hypothetical protein
LETSDLCMGYAEHICVKNYDGVQEVRAEDGGDGLGAEDDNEGSDMCFYFSDTKIEFVPIHVLRFENLVVATILHVASHFFRICYYYTCCIMFLFCYPYAHCAGYSTFSRQYSYTNTSTSDAKYVQLSSPHIRPVLSHVLRLCTSSVKYNDTNTNNASTHS